MNRKQAEWLRGELASWRKEGLLGEEQAQRILNRPDYLQALSGAPSRTLTRVFAVLGALLVGVGVILFISSNWRAVPNGLKLALIFGNILVAYALADRWKFGARPMPGLAAGLYFLGVVAYGAGIHLVAQLYNFHADWRTGLLAWALGALPLAYTVDSRPTLWLSLGLSVWWISAHFGFLETIVLHQLLGAFFVLAALRHWQPMELPRFAKIYFVTGSVMILYSTLLMTFNEVANDFSPQDIPEDYWRYAGGLLGLYGAALAGTLLRKDGPKDMARRRLVLGLTAALAPGLLLLATDEPGKAYLIFVNLILFAECVGLILFGVALRSKLYVNLAMGFFFALVVCRYFDSYWRYLPRSVFFIVGGVLLLGLGFFLEKKRRLLIAGMQTRESI